MRSPPRRPCDHCGRDDVGSKRAGIAVVKVPVVNPTNHDVVVGHRELVVCRPTVAYRPFCDTLVATHGHPKGCALCALYNPPGAEQQHGRRPRGGRK